MLVFRVVSYLPNWLALNKQRKKHIKKKKRPPGAGGGGGGDVKVDLTKPKVQGGGWNNGDRINGLFQQLIGVITHITHI